MMNSIDQIKLILEEYRKKKEGALNTTIMAPLSNTFPIVPEDKSASSWKTITFLIILFLQSALGLWFYYQMQIAQTIKVFPNDEHKILSNDISTVVSEFFIRHPILFFFIPIVLLIVNFIVETVNKLVQFVKNAITILINSLLLPLWGTIVKYYLFKIDETAPTDTVDTFLFYKIKFQLSTDWIINYIDNIINKQFGNLSLEAQQFYINDLSNIVKAFDKGFLNGKIYLTNFLIALKTKFFPDLIQYSSIPPQSNFYTYLICGTVCLAICTGFSIFVWKAFFEVENSVFLLEYKTKLTALENTINDLKIQTNDVDHRLNILKGLLDTTITDLRGEQLSVAEGLKNAIKQIHQAIL